MTIPRKGSRKVIVDGETYRWLASLEKQPLYKQITGTEKYM